MPKKLNTITMLLISLVILGGCTPSPDAPEQPTTALELAAQEEIDPTDTSNDDTGEEAAMTMSLTSPAFNNGEAIPTQYSCDGEDLSPDLDWFGIPQGTQSLALIMDDLDASVGIWVHWVLYNIPADKPGLRTGITGVGLDGTNSWGSTGYGGPCPPGGTHRYFFKLYALDTMLDLNPGSNKQALLAALEGHILAQAELMGTFTR